MPVNYMASFREATALLCLSSTELGRLFGVSGQTIKQMRLDTSSTGYRTPPPGWEEVLRPLVEERIRQLQDLAKELKGAA